VGNEGTPKIAFSNELGRTKAHGKMAHKGFNSKALSWAGKTQEARRKPESTARTGGKPGKKHTGSSRKTGGGHRHPMDLAMVQGLGRRTKMKSNRRGGKNQESGSRQPPNAQERSKKKWGVGRQETNKEGEPPLWRGVKQKKWRAPRWGLSGGNQSIDRERSRKQMKANAGKRKQSPSKGADRVREKLKPRYGEEHGTMGEKKTKAVKKSKRMDEGGDCPCLGVHQGGKRGQFRLTAGGVGKVI